MTAVHSTGIDLLERLGGTDAQVHRAVVRTTGRVVVAKRATWDRPEITARLGREAAILARVQHPSLVRRIDCIDDVAGRCLLLAHAPGGTLASMVAGGERLDPAAVTDLGARLAGALATLHAAGVVHRDVHPGNVLLDAELQPVLADLDNALDSSGPALAGDDEVVGHPAHVDHRLLTGAAPGPASDLHALATTLWTLATGAPPARDDAASPVALPRHPAVPPPLRALLVDCVTARIHDAADLRVRLEELHGAFLRATGDVTTPGVLQQPTSVSTRRATPVPPEQASRATSATGGGTRRWGPRPALGGRASRATPPAGRRRMLPLLAAVAVVLLGLAGWLVRPAAPASEPVAVAPPPVCDDTRHHAAGQQVLADLDGDGCAEVLTLHDGELQLADGRFRVGEPGDVLLAGDWDGDGRWGIGLYRPATGAVYLIDEPGTEATSRPAQQHAVHGRPTVVVADDQHVVRVDTSRAPR